MGVGVGKYRGQEKVFPKKKIKRQKVVKFMKRKSPRICQSYSPFPRPAKQISESLKTDTKIKETLYTMFT